MIYALLFFAIICIAVAMRHPLARLFIYPVQRRLMECDETVDLLLSLMRQPEGWEHDDWRIYHPATNVDVWTHDGERGLAINIGKGVGTIIPNQKGGVPIRGFERSMIWSAIETRRNGIPDQTIIDFAVASQKFAESIRLRDQARKSTEQRFIDQTAPHRD